MQTDYQVFSQTSNCYDKKNSVNDNKRSLIEEAIKDKPYALDGQGLGMYYCYCKGQFTTLDLLPLFKSD
jgi:hypothetical protein